MTIFTEKEAVTAISFFKEENCHTENAPKDPLALFVKKELEGYFQKTVMEFSFPMNPQGSAFQKKVWDALLEIPFGETVSYLEFTKRIADEKAIRAVASSIGKNPIMIAIPCHRVIGSDGSLTGYAGGLDAKKALLELEGRPTQKTLPL